MEVPLNSIAETASLGCGRKPALSEVSNTNEVDTASGFRTGSRKRIRYRFPAREALLGSAVLFPRRRRSLHRRVDRKHRLASLWQIVVEVGRQIRFHFPVARVVPQIAPLQRVFVEIVEFALGAVVGDVRQFSVAVDQREIEAEVAAQIWAAPPSTNSSVPVTKVLSSEARKTAALAISSGVPNRPIGTLFTILANICWPAGPDCASRS